jgi:hypothetical protein
MKTVLSRFANLFENSIAINKMTRATIDGIIYLPVIRDRAYSGI